MKIGKVKTLQKNVKSKITIDRSLSFMLGFMRYIKKTLNMI